MVSEQWTPPGVYNLGEDQYNQKELTEGEL